MQFITQFMSNFFSWGDFLVHFSISKEPGEGGSTSDVREYFLTKFYSQMVESAACKPCLHLLTSPTVSPKPAAA